MNVLMIPGCDDTNRGDQALIWESVRLAQDAGIIGRYQMISTDESSEQSQKVGIESISYILPHPSVHFRNLNDNRQYHLKLKLLWGMRAIGDLCVAVPLMFSCFRKIFKLFLTKKKRKAVSAFENADIAIVKGGGFLHAKSGLAETYKIFFFLYHIYLAHAMGIPVLVMPNSYGPFDGAITRKMVGKALSKCLLVTSRESISHDVLQNECKVNSLTTMDLGAYLPIDEEFNAMRYLLSIGIDLRDKKSVVITVRPYRFPGQDNPKELYQKYVNSFVALVEWLVDNHYYPVFAEHVYSDNYHESDIKAIEDVTAILKHRGINDYGIVADHSLTCRQIKNIYSCFDYMVGTRFHSVIFALFADVPSIAISYGGNKGTGIMKDMHMDDYTIPIEAIDDWMLIDKFKKLVDNRNEYLERFNSEKERVMNQRESLIEVIQNRLGGKKIDENTITNR